MKKACCFLLILAPFLAALLLSCASPQNGGIALLPPIEGAEAVGTETCALCHEGVVERFRSTDHGRYSGSMEEGEILGCESCHGPGSLHMEAGGGVGQYIINPARNPEPCFACHLSVKVTFNLEVHHPVREQRMNCVDCHDPHGKDIYKAKGMRVGRENEVCMQCHKEQVRPRVFEHEALRDGCTICHGPHGAINDKMLVENDNNLCLKCHAQIAMPRSITMGDFSHTTRLAEGTCWSAGCHTAVHGSDINPHLRY